MESGMISLPLVALVRGWGGRTDDYAVVTLVTDWACGPLGPWVT
jgi:hypothetical protein